MCRISEPTIVSKAVDTPGQTELRTRRWASNQAAGGVFDYFNFMFAKKMEMQYRNWLLRWKSQTNRLTLCVVWLAALVRMAHEEIISWFVRFAWPSSLRSPLCFLR